MNSSFVPRLVLEYAVFSQQQDATKPLVVMSRGKDGEHLTDFRSAAGLGVSSAIRI